MLRSSWRFIGAALLLWAHASSASGLRVVSQTVGTDEMLLALAEPEQVAALSHQAYEPAFSAVAAAARQYPRLGFGDAETVLKYQPTLFLAADYSRAELVEQVRRAGVRVLIFERYASLDDAYANLRRLAAALGGASPEKAEAIIADCEERVAWLKTRLAGRRLVRVIAPSTYGVIPGRNTTVQDICDHAGAENLASTLGELVGHAPPPNEKMLIWPIERVVLAAESVEEALAPYRKLPPYAFMPAIREARVALIKPYMLSTVTHYRVDAYEMLARQLHPEAFE